MGVSREEYLQLLQWKIEDRALQEGQWLLDSPSTSIRRLAEEFCIGKSQAHRDLHSLKHLDDDLYVQVKRILKSHRKSRF